MARFLAIEDLLFTMLELSTFLLVPAKDPDGGAEDDEDDEDEKEEDEEWWIGWPGAL